MKHYAIKFTTKRNFSSEDVKTAFVLANSKAEAWINAKNMIYATEKKLAFLWVAGVTFNNGNYKKFNTNEKKPY